MRIRAFALLFVMWGLPAMAQQGEPAAAASPPSNNSAATTSGQQPEENSPPVANPESKPADTPALDLTPDANGQLSQEQMQKLLRVVADKDIGNDKPLDAKDAAKEEEKIQKVIDKRKNESEEERRKREEKEEKEVEDGRKFVREVADAYNFKLVGTELLGGREAWVIEGEPRPGYEPHMKDAKYLTKFHGRVWIDKDDLQLAKMDVECLDTISWGLFLARFHKGSRFMLEQTRVNDEVWLPQHVTAKIDVRLGLVKNFDVGVEQTYRDYKKFRTSSRIVGMGEVQDQK